MINKAIPLPEDRFLTNATLYQGKQMYIGITNTEVNLYPGRHFHDGYEFLIPLTDMPFITIDYKNYYGYKNQIVPINPFQVHGISEPMLNKRCIDIVMARNFICNAAEEVFSTNNIEFCTGNFIPSKQLLNIIEKYIEEGKVDLPGKALIMESLGSTLAVFLLREINCNKNQFQDRHSTDYPIRIRNVIQYMSQNCRAECSLNELSEVAGMSIHHFIRVFKKVTGKTPYEYLLDIKIEHVKTLLAKKEMSVMEICFECGFNNVSHFTRIFKKKAGVSPSLYRLKFNG